MYFLLQASHCPHPKRTRPSGMNQDMHSHVQHGTHQHVFLRDVSLEEEKEEKEEKGEGRRWRERGGEKGRGGRGGGRR